MGSKNIFDIWKEINMQVPFAVKKTSWSNKSNYVIVERIESNGKYGKAFGYPTHDGVVNEYFDYNKRWTQTREIPNSGVGKWEYVDDVSLEVIKK